MDTDPNLMGVPSEETASGDVLDVAGGPARPRISRGVKKTMLAIGAALLLFTTASALVYLRLPTDPTVRALTSFLPYPAAVVGRDVITVRAYLAERDALNAYFETTAAQTNVTPSEQEITTNILETLVHKTAVHRLADREGVTVDAARVDAFYQEAVGTSGEAAFASELRTMFGWEPAQFRSRVVEPVVLAMQLSERIADDAERQDGRRQQAEAAYGRLVAGEDFSKVAADVGGEASSAAGGDVGYVGMADVPDEWKDEISSLSPGGYTTVLEGEETFLIFKLTDRVEAGEDTQVKLSIISVPKVTLEEEVQDYLSSVRVWKLIGRS